MDLGLAGKTAIVTGGASNIGKAITEGLFGEGANVVIADIDEKQAQRVVDELQASGGSKVMFVKTDVGDRNQVQDMAERALEAFGQIDILINNAGWTNNALFVDKPYQDFEKEISINLWGPIHCIRAVAPSMIERSYGKIITIGSDAGRVGEYNEAVYGACKGGIIALSKALACEFGKYQLNVNVVCPGLTLPENPADAGDHSLWRQGFDSGPRTTPEGTGSRAGEHRGGNATSASGNAPWNRASVRNQRVGLLLVNPGIG